MNKNTMELFKIFIGVFNEFKWNYKQLPVKKNCKVIIKHYGGNYEIVNYINGVFRKHKKIFIFKEDFKKWSYIP